MWLPQVIMDLLRNLAPAIAIIAFGMTVAFNGINWQWQRDKKTRKFGLFVFACGLLFVLIGLLALGNCCALLIALAVVGLVGLGWRFALKDP